MKEILEKVKNSPLNGIKIAVTGVVNLWNTKIDIPPFVVDGISNALTICTKQSTYCRLSLENGVIRVVSVRNNGIVDIFKIYRLNSCDNIYKRDMQDIDKWDTGVFRLEEVADFV